MTEHARVERCDTLWVMMAEQDGRLLPLSLPGAKAIACTSCPHCSGPDGWLSAYAQLVAGEMGVVVELVAFHRGEPIAAFGAQRN